MGKKEIEDEIIVKIFDLEEKFDELGDQFRDIARLLLRHKNSKDEI